MSMVAARPQATMSLLLTCLLGCNPLATSAEMPSARDGCPVTLPSHWPTIGTSIPWATEESLTHGWYGSGSLAALVPDDGLWIGTGAERNYFDKFWWWRPGYDAHDEPRPDLVVSAVRLDGLAPAVEVQDATSGFGNGWDAMLVGMAFPTRGCWEIRGTYNGAQQLIVVVFVGDG